MLSIKFNNKKLKKEMIGMYDREETILMYKISGSIKEEIINKAKENVLRVRGTGNINVLTDTPAFLVILDMSKMHSWEIEELKYQIALGTFEHSKIISVDKNIDKVCRIIDNHENIDKSKFSTKSFMIECN